MCSRSLRRVGGSSVTKVDVRIVTATNRDLMSLVKEGRFRADLFYRLNVVPLVLPALRERASDVPLLARHFLAAANRRAGTVELLGRPSIAG